MLNTDTCESAGDLANTAPLEVGTWRADWQLWAAWAGCLLVSAMATALLASAIPARKEIHSNERQNAFREKIAARRKEEADDQMLGVDIGSGEVIDLRPPNQQQQPAVASPGGPAPVDNFFRHDGRPRAHESNAEAQARYQRQVESSMQAASQQAAMMQEAAAAQQRPVSSRPMPTSRGGAGPGLGQRVQSMPQPGATGGRPAMLVGAAAQAAEMERLRLQLAHAQVDRDAAYSQRGSGGGGGGGSSNVLATMSDLLPAGGDDSYNPEEDEAAMAAEAARRSSVAMRMARLSTAGQSGHHMTARPVSVQARPQGLTQSMGPSYASSAPPPPSRGPPPPPSSQRRASATALHRFN
jgi:hypothetical protein